MDGKKLGLNNLPFNTSNMGKFDGVLIAGAVAVAGYFIYKKMANPSININIPNPFDAVADAVNNTIGTPNSDHSNDIPLVNTQPIQNAINNTIGTPNAWTDNNPTFFNPGNIPIIGGLFSKTPDIQIPENTNYTPEQIADFNNTYATPTVTVGQLAGYPSQLGLTPSQAVVPGLWTLYGPGDYISGHVGEVHHLYVSSNPSAVQSAFW